MTTLVSCQGCGIQTVPDLCCPKCGELGRTSFFCGQDCFKTSWKLHSRLHNVIKKSQITNAQRYHPTNASTSSLDYTRTNNSSAQSNTYNHVTSNTRSTPQLPNTYRTGTTDEHTAVGGEDVSSLSITGTDTRTRINGCGDTSTGRRKDHGNTDGTSSSAVLASTSVVTGGIDKYILENKDGPSVVFDRTKFDNTAGTSPVASLSTGGNRVAYDPGNNINYSCESHKGGKSQINTANIWASSHNATRTTTTSMSVSDRAADWDTASDPIEVPSTAFGLPPHKFRPVYPIHPNEVSPNTATSTLNSGTGSRVVSSDGGGVGGTCAAASSRAAGGSWTRYVWNAVTNVSRLPRDYDKWRKRKTSGVGGSGTTGGRPSTGDTTTAASSRNGGAEPGPIGGVSTKGSDWATTAVTGRGSIWGVDECTSTNGVADRSVVQQIILLVYSVMRLISEFCMVVTTVRSRHDVIGRVKPTTDTPTSRRMRMFLIALRIMCAAAAVYIIIFKAFRKTGNESIPSRVNGSPSVLNVLTSNMKKSPGVARGVST